MIKNLKSLFLSLAISTLIYGGSVMAEAKDIIHMTLKDGVVKMETRPDLAPKHVAQIKQLISEGQYDGVVFHRVIDGFMAQTGDVEFGNSTNDKFNMSRAGTGGSNLPDIPAEFSDAIMEGALFQWQEHKILIVQTVSFLLSLMMLAS